MAVLNPPRSLPGLGRAIVNFLIDSRRAWTEEQLVEAFKPPGLNEAATAGEGVTHTLYVLRAIELLTLDAGTVTVAGAAARSGSALTPAGFRRALQEHVFDLARDGDPWQVGPGDVYTSGARDLTRALSWFLAQDALGRPLSWTGNIQQLQLAQFPDPDNETWALTNDTRWGAFARWARALGMASPPLVLQAPLAQSKSALVPLPVVAIEDALEDTPAGRMPIGEFLDTLAARIPVLHGGLIRASLTQLLPGGDPDPGIRNDCADSSVGQALRVLEERGRLSFTTLPDADGVRLSRFDTTRQTHVALLQGGTK
ncbi:protein DpdG [Streptomyces sp. NPDC004237]|uniref:protein DpdG n=1 Tax=Streptomyces sp. NPDC004237 TaxID=3154455 RepID=UPI0033BD8BCF